MARPKKAAITAAKAFVFPRPQIYNLRSGMTRLRSGMRNSKQSASIASGTSHHSGAAAQKRRISSARTNRSNRLNGANSNSNNEGIKCAICLDTERSRIMEHIPCGHSFHKKCCMKWLSRSSACPVCRTPVITISSPEVPLEDEIPNYRRVHQRRRRRHVFISQRVRQRIRQRVRERVREMLNSASIIIIDVYRFRQPPSR